ncbi:MAG: RNA 2',3'-cyclic phosphodiesterase [Desulfobacteraceae bacterium]
MADKSGSRLFMAVSIPQETALFLNSLQTRLKQNGIKASWTDRQAMHLTIKFLGDVSPEHIPLLKKCMEKAACNFEPFYLYTGGIGVFPSVKKARVFWSKVKGETETLERLHRSIENELFIHGFEPDKRGFHPHLTLGRTKKRVSPEKVYELMLGFKGEESDRFQVSGIHLFKSDLKPSGAVHSRLFTADFS